MHRADIKNLAILRNFLSRNPVVVELARASSAVSSSLCQIVLFERSWAFVVAASAGETLQPRRLVESEIEIRSLGESVDGENPPSPSQGGDEGPDDETFSAPIVDPGGDVVGAVTVWGTLGVEPSTVIESIARSVAELISTAKLGTVDPEETSIDLVAVLDGLRDAVVVVDADFNIKWVNQAVGSLFCRTPSDLIGRNATELIHPDDHHVALDSMVRIATGAHLYRQVVRIENGEGAWGLVEITGTDQSGNPDIGGIVMSLRSSEIEAEREQTQRQRRAMSELLLERMSDGIVATDAVGSITVVNRAAREVFGIADDVLPGSLTWRDFPLLGARGSVVTKENHPLRVLFGARFVAENEMSVAKLAGGHHYLSVSQRSVVGSTGETHGSFVTFHDVTAARDAQSELLSQALHDQLTGLPNRRMLGEYLIDLKLVTTDSDQRLAACFIDLDVFKLVNDTHGHSTGDQMIRMAADRLSSMLRDGDLLVRIGGDEFVVVLADVESDKLAKDTADRLRACLGAPFLIDGLRFDITASVGVALARVIDLDADNLLRRADIALYAAKARGRNRTELFDEALEVATEIEERQRRMLRYALDNDGIVMHFQPLIDSRTGEPTGFEALARCIDLQGRLHGPNVFLESVEGSGMIWELDQRAFTLSCEAAAVLASVSPEQIPTVSCNFSPLSIVQTEFVDFINATTKAHGVKPENICIEITESAAFSGGSASTEAVSRLSDDGYEIALDDFGTGYSSLSHLLELPLSSVKVDKSFVAKLNQDSPERAIAEAVVSLADDLGLGIVAEGVETQSQLDAAKGLGFDVIQGWYYAPAMPLDELLHRWTKTRQD